MTTKRHIKLVARITLYAALLSALLSVATHGVQLADAVRHFRAPIDETSAIHRRRAHGRGVRFFPV